MANELEATVTVSMEAVLQKVADLLATAAQAQIGSNGFPEITHTFENGTAAGQANEMYLDQLTIPAGGSVNIDLTGSTSYTNPFGETLAFTAVRLVLISVIDPASSKAVLVGPQGVTDAAQLWFGDVEATDYETVEDVSLHYRTTGGWTITNDSADLLPISNEGVADVEVAVLILGTR